MVLKSDNVMEVEIKELVVEGSVEITWRGQFLRVLNPIVDESLNS